MNDKHVLAMTVKNNAGVLARISSLFGRRGYNIDSVSSSPTNEGTVSRITMVVRGDESILHQLMLQTAKLEEVIRVSELSQEKALYRELLMVKVFADEKTRTPIREICDIYGANHRPFHKHHGGGTDGDSPKNRRFHGSPRAVSHRGDEPHGRDRA
jgi:acetolactate synthase-1/3 small subunit